ncbi:PDZ domain-containing protein [Symmachiella dynata]|uniref:PDZ domain-containing protein n=1 Tax=Symmachiella dynata TaxID=2527995 RepID=UPI0030ECCD99
MTFRDQLLLLTAFILLFPLPLLGDDESAQQSAMIQQDIAALSSDNFAEREAATKRLKTLGRPAIAPLAKAASNAELETTNRVLQVLASFYDNNDDATLDELDAALEELVESAEPSAARRAAAAIAVHADDRDRRAIKKLKELKAMVLPAGINGPNEDIGGPLQIWIDDQWQGGDKELRQFRRLRPGRLQAVYRVQDCPASLDAVRKLEQQIPNSSVQERGAACLGLQAGPPKARGFEIQKATPEGSIAAAGIRDRDVIIKYAGQVVDNFEQLVEMIKKNKVGDTVKVEFLRSIKNDDNLDEEVQLSADVRLKSWREFFQDKKRNERKKAEGVTIPSKPIPTPFPTPKAKPTPKPTPENNESLDKK